MEGRADMRRVFEPYPIPAVLLKAGQHCRPTSPDVDEPQLRPVTFDQLLCTYCDLQNVRPVVATEGGVGTVTPDLVCFLTLVCPYAVEHSPVPLFPSCSHMHAPHCFS
jgi:hypothetical protein